MLSKKNIQNKLAKHFHHVYGEYEDTAEFYGTDDETVWKFLIPNTDKTVVLECNKETGEIIETFLSTKEETARLEKNSLEEGKRLIKKYGLENMKIIAD